MKKGNIRKKAVIALVLALVLVLALTACEELAEPPKVQSRIFFEYFDTVSTVYDYSGSSNEKFSEDIKKIEAEIKRYHELYDIYNSYDGTVNIWTVNENAGKGPVAVGEEIINLLEFSREMYDLTDGEVNVAMGAVLKIWHDSRSEGVRLPERASLEAAAQHCDINDLVIDRAAGTVELRDPLMRLDVGAVAKGYAAECVADFMEAEGLDAYALDMGGNLRVGEKTDGSGWSTGVENPVSGGYLDIIELKNAARATSGGYQRYYVVDGVRYHHIIDKDTLFPKNDYVLVSVLAPHAGVADALTTALFNASEEEAADILSRFDDVTVVYLLEGGEARKYENGSFEALN